MRREREMPQPDNDAEETLKKEVKVERNERTEVIKQQNESFVSL